MTELIVLLTVFAFGLVILNGFAAGTVAFLYFWRKSRGVSRRALAAGLVVGMVTAGSLSGAMLADDLGDALPATIGLLFVALVCGLASLPGAFMMSRKIASADVVGDTFR